MRIRAASFSPRTLRDQPQFIDHGDRDGAGAVGTHACTAGSLLQCDALSMTCEALLAVIETLRPHSFSRAVRQFAATFAILR